MEGDHTIEPLCTVRQIEDFYQPVEPSFPRCFDIAVDFEVLCLVTETDDDDPVPCVCWDGAKTFRFDVDRLLQIDTAKWTLLNMLLGLGVGDNEDHVSIVDEIIQVAAEMASEERNQDLHILPMGVSIKYLVSTSWQNEGEEDDMTMNEEEDADEFTLMDGEYDYIMAETTTAPMPHESFEEKLKTVMIVEGEELTCCAICIEDICAGSSATSMPCSHSFHGDCIRKWLADRRDCPLCRFEI